VKPFYLSSETVIPFNLYRYIKAVPVAVINAPPEDEGDDGEDDGENGGNRFGGAVQVEST
jgi:hypothetical protein